MERPPRVSLCPRELTFWAPVETNGARVVEKTASSNVFDDEWVSNVSGDTGSCTECVLSVEEKGGELMMRRFESGGGDQLGK